MNKASKTFYAIVIVFMAISFVLPQLIRFRFVVFVFALAFLAAILTEKIQHATAILVALVVVLLEFFHVLPLPYQYLFSHGVYMSGAILITVLAAVAYIAFFTCIAYQISKKSKKM